MTQTELLNTIRAEIERRMKEYDAIIANQATSMRAERSAWKWAECKSLLSFLDTLQEPENPIYELNQFLINWIRDGQTDAEKDARWEAYRRFFELHDEAMMQEPEVDLEEEIERFLASEESTTYVSSGKFTTSYKDPKKIARHFAEWGAKNAK